MMKSLAKNSSFNLIYTLLNMLFPLLTSMYVSRIIFSDGVGKVAYVQTTASYFLLFASLGIQNYGLREISKFRNNPIKKNKLFTQLLVINTLTTTIALSVFISMVCHTPSMQKNLPLYLACGLTICWNYFNVDWLYQGEEEYVYIVSKNIFIKIFSLLAMVLFVKTREDYVAFAWITSIADGGNHVFNIINARKHVSISFKDFEIKPHVKPILIFGVGTLVASIYSKIDITMLGILTTESNVGYYTYGHKIINLILSLATAVTSVYLPRLCFWYGEDKAEFTSLLEQGIQALSFLAFPMSAGLFILAPDVVCLLFGSEFLPSAITVRVFSPLVIICGFGNLVCYQLGICTGQEKIRLPAAFLASVTNITMNLILIPYMAEIGAAIASVISELITNGYQIMKLRKTINIPLPRKTFSQALMSTIVMCIFVVTINRLVRNRILSIAFSIGTGIIVYFILNLLMKNELLLSIIHKLNCKLFFKK